MKRIKKCIVVVLLSTISTYAQTKSETIEWLNQKFAEYKGDLNIVQIVLKNQNSDEEHLVFIDHYGSFMYGYQVYSMNIKSIKMEKAPYGNYNFILFSSKALVQTEFERIDGELIDLSKSPKMLNSLKLVTTSDSESAIQIRKALIHLINSTGGNILKDNLFDKKN